MTDNPPSTTPDQSILMYQTEDGKTKLSILIEGETIWMTQTQIADLYQTSIPNINIHISNILKEGELDLERTIKDYLIVQKEGNREISRKVAHYNLEMIIAIGYRVRSHRGTQFRRWATDRLHEYLVKGFTLDDERLKEGKTLGTDYFDELLERIRDIRASEKRFYQKIKEIYTLSIDYDPRAPTTKEFFQIVQNKIHYAISGHTAAELIADRADATKPNMGLTSFKGAIVRQGDVTVAKNYMNSDEIEQLNRLVVMWLDYAEDQAKRKTPVYMKDWREKLDRFLTFNERAILEHAGKISMEQAREYAREQYQIYNAHRVELSDKDAENEFEEVVKQLEDGKRKEIGNSLGTENHSDDTS
ncbi:virulence RhuM family protein [Methanospirillum purgamenti]|nr:virulence RhuM family protein [Methanospirillum hungatei]